MLSKGFPEGGMYCNARMLNWPHRHRTLLPGIASPGLRQSKGEHLEAGNLSALISPLLTGMCGWCDYILFFWILGLGVSGCHKSLKQTR